MVDTSGLLLLLWQMTSLTELLMLLLLRPQEVVLCSALAQFEQHLSFASHVVLSPLGEEVILL